MILRILITMVAGWMQDYQQQVSHYLREENRVLKVELSAHTESPAPLPYGAGPATPEVGHELDAVPPDALGGARHH
jgi:hypothetical protein